MYRHRIRHYLELRDLVEVHVAIHVGGLGIDRLHLLQVFGHGRDPAHQRGHGDDGIAPAMQDEGVFCPDQELGCRLQEIVTALHTLDKGGAVSAALELTDGHSRCPTSGEGPGEEGRDSEL